MPTYTIDQKVYITRLGSWHASYTPGKVSRITPTGIVSVQVGENTYRFNPKGDEMNNTSSRYRSFLDTTPFDERTASIERGQRLTIAAEIVKAVKADERVKAEWNKDGLMEEVARLEAMLFAARAAVEAV